jgi:hypothetical protein
LKENFTRIGIEEIFIESSPFLRAMMTSSIICKELGLNKYHIDYTYCEYLGGRQYDYNPIPELLIRNKPKDYLLKTYLNNIDFVDDKSPYADQMLSAFKENEKIGWGRC